MITTWSEAQGRKRAGITLTEILISIMILGIGVVSLATLFPIGLLRLREAQRQTRSAFLAESSQADMAAQALLNKATFLNPFITPWYAGPAQDGPPVMFYPFTSYDPFIQDTPAAYQDWSGGGNGNINGAGVYRGLGGLGIGNQTQVSANGVGSISGAGLPIVYDPLWRQKTGVYLAPGNLEARFASGIGFLRNDPDGGFPSAHGLQRLTNLGSAYPLPAGQQDSQASYLQRLTNPNLGSRYGVSILQAFVSPEDVVWQEPTVNTYSLAWAQDDATTKGVGSNVVINPSPVVPDLSISTALDRNGNSYNTYQQTVDFRYTWLFTGQQSDTSRAKFFDGNIVIMENRPFSIDPVVTATVSTYRVAGEVVVEAVFGYNPNVVPFVANGPVGFGAASDRVVLLRWRADQPDPDIKVGSWIADVTYERNLGTALSRFSITPAQRCYWYQVSKVTQPADATGSLVFADGGVPYRYVMVWTGTKLQAKTVLNTDGSPAVLNAALVCPHVVNVFPRTFTMN
jgi:type II secretory pathway pseudopilin PulG